MRLGVATLETDLEGVLGLATRALSLCETSQTALLLSASFATDALVLGALQREDTLRARSAARFDTQIVRRATTGTEAQLSGAVLYHALVLPRVDALFPDASARTLLNRNLRALLRGYAAAGVPLRYFGSEVLALLGHPVALVGYDQWASGAVLIELLIGLENPCVVRPALRRQPPSALYPLLGARPAPRSLLARAVSGVVERLGASVSDVNEALARTQSVSRPDEDFEGVEPASVAIPLGAVEAVAVPHLRITGDLLVSRAALGRVEALANEALARAEEPSADVLAPLTFAPLDGARPADLLQALSQAARLRLS